MGLIVSTNFGHHYNALVAVLEEKTDWVSIETAGLENLKRISAFSAEIGEWDIRIRLSHVCVVLAYGHERVCVRLSLK